MISLCAIQVCDVIVSLSAGSAGVNQTDRVLVNFVLRKSSTFNILNVIFF